MKKAYFVCLFQLLAITFLMSQSNPVPLFGASQANPKTQSRIFENYGKLPLTFEANQGQTDAQVRFLSRTSGYSLFLTGDEAVLTLSGKKPQGLVSGHRFSDAASGSRKGVPSAADP